VQAAEAERLLAQRVHGRALLPDAIQKTAKRKGLRQHQRVERIHILQAEPFFRMPLQQHAHKLIRGSATSTSGHGSARHTRCALAIPCTGPRTGNRTPVRLRAHLSLYRLPFFESAGSAVAQASTEPGAYQ
jgi:hypothetical protein